MGTLVGYSGFSATNYLSQPYNSDLDFGTGDFSIMGWASVNTTSTQRLCGRNDSTSSKRLSLYATGGSLNFYIRDTSTANVATPISSTGAWFFFTCVRDNGTSHIYINGELKGSTASVQDVTTVLASPFIVGAESFDQGATVNSPATAASLALLRISATAPSAQQIKDIYEAERPLFTENAQATLYGTSDSVTALAHDSDTNLLHVGTSSGRSVFQGLQRVSNTTTAVGSAISASNGLVVED